MYILIMLIVIAVFQVILADVLQKILRELKYTSDVLNYFADQYFTDAEYEEEYEDEVDLETLINESVLERERLFDSRIEEMKKELRNEQPMKQELSGQMSFSDLIQSTHGEILEEGIYNIPHNYVPMEDDTIEVAD